MDRARKHLLRYRLIEEESDGKLVITDKGQMVNALPLGIEMGISIIAAADYFCTEEIAIIAAVASKSDSGKDLFLDRFTEENCPVKAKSGDLYTSLKANAIY